MPEVTSLCFASFRMMDEKSVFKVRIARQRRPIPRNNKKTAVNFTEELLVASAMGSSVPMMNIDRVLIKERKRRARKKGGRYPSSRGNVSNPFC